METIDFLGVPIRIDGLKIKTFASGTPRWQISISIPANDQNESLATQVARNVTKEAFAGFGFAQGALDFDQPASDHPKPPADYVVMQAMNDKGDPFFPHHYIPSANGHVCGACELVSDHGIHSEASIAARAANDRSVRQPPQTEEITNTSGSTGDDLADKLIRDTIDDGPVRVEPKDEAEAEAQAEAKAALGARSRR